MSKFSHFLRLLLVSRSIMMMIIDAGQVQRINGKARAKYSAKMHDETQDWMMLMFILAAVHFTAELGSSDGPGNEKHPETSDWWDRKYGGPFWKCRAHADQG